MANKFLCGLLILLSIFANQAVAQQVIYAAVAEGFQDGLQSKYLKYIAEQLGVKIEIGVMPFARRVQALRNGQLDLMVGVQRRESHQDEFVYIEPAYERLSYRFFTLKGNEQLLTRYTDLRGKYIGVNRHAKYFTPFNVDKNLKKFEVTSLRQSIELLTHGRIDLFIHYQQSTLPLLAELELGQQVVMTEYQPEHQIEHFLVISSHSSLMAQQARLAEIVEQAIANKALITIRRQHYNE